MDAKAMFKLTYGLFVLTAHEDDKDNGCIINTAMQVTAEPNRICIAVNKDNYTHDMIMRTSEFSISVISQKADFELFRHFGFQSGREVDKFANYDRCQKSTNGTMIVLDGTNAYLSAHVTDVMDLGTHTLFVAEVTDMAVLNDDMSASYEYYHTHIKPQPQEPLAQEQGKTVWRCMICNYEYEGGELPADFVCPWCKHPASDFEKIAM